MNRGHMDPELPVCLMIFMGAPHHGMDVTALAKLLKSQPPLALISELHQDSPTLRRLNDDFREVAGGIRIITCYETQRTRTVVEVRTIYLTSLRGGRRQSAVASWSCPISRTILRHPSPFLPRAPLK
jgi:hypothetical protein